MFGEIAASRLFLNILVFKNNLKKMHIIFENTQFSGNVHLNIYVGIT